LQNVKLRLEAWRDAEHRRDGFALGSTEWQEGEAEVRSAARAYHAEVARMSARYAEAEFQDRNPWAAHLDRFASGADDLVVADFLAGWPTR